MYDVVPDVRSAVNATLRGEYRTAVTAMRRAASQNADGLVASSERGSALADALASDRTLVQQAAYALNVYDNPPRTNDRDQRGVSDQDAYFMQAALRAVLERSLADTPGSPREAALNALERARRAGDARISTRSLIDALTAPEGAKTDR